MQSCSLPDQKQRGCTALHAAQTASATAGIASEAEQGCLAKRQVSTHWNNCQIPPIRLVHHAGRCTTVNLALGSLLSMLMCSHTSTRPSSTKDPLRVPGFRTSCLAPFFPSCSRQHMPFFPSCSCQHMPYIRKEPIKLSLSRCLYTTVQKVSWLVRNRIARCASQGSTGQIWGS